MRVHRSSLVASEFGSPGLPSAAIAANTADPLGCLMLGITVVNAPRSESQGMAAPSP